MSNKEKESAITKMTQNLQVLVCHACSLLEDSCYFVHWRLIIESSHQTDKNEKKENVSVRTFKNFMKILIEKRNQLTAFVVFVFDVGIEESSGFFESVFSLFPIQSIK